MFRTMLKILTVLLYFASSQPVFAQAQANPADQSDFAFQEKDGCSVQMEYDPRIDGAPVIHLRIDGVEMPFALDTGDAYGITLDSWAADKLKLKKIGDSTEYGKKIGDVVEFHSLSFVFAPGSDTFDYTPDKYIATKRNIHQKSVGFSHRKIAGIVGIQLIRPMCTQFDFVRNRITFFISKHPPIHIPGAMHLALQQLAPQDGDYRLTHRLLLPDGTAVNMLMDTGAFTSSIPRTVANHLRKSSTGTASIASTHDTGTSGVVVSSDLTLLYPYLDIAGQREPDITLTGKWDYPDFGTFGIDFLARFRVTMDFPNNVMVLERATDYSSRVRYLGKAYTRLQRRDGGYYADSLEEGSPAQKAGLRKGDKIVSIDGYDLGTLSSDIVAYLLLGYANGTAELKASRKVKGKTETQTIRYARGSIFNPNTPFTDNLGMGLRFGADGKTTAVITKNSAAERAGIRNNDEIVAINGNALRSLNADQLLREILRFAGKETTLTVKRAGESVKRGIPFTLPKFGS